MAQLDPLEPEMQRWVHLQVLTLQEAWELECLCQQTPEDESSLAPQHLQEACSRLWLAEVPLSTSPQ
jgi:hypothetical protein